MAGQDPFAGFVPTMAPDTQGWNSGHPYLSAAIDDNRPDIVVDKWLGAADHWRDPGLQGLIPRRNGFPLLYFVFMTNMAAEKLTATSGVKRPLRQRLGPRSNTEIASNLRRSWSNCAAAEPWSGHRGFARGGGANDPPARRPAWPRPLERRECRRRGRAAPWC